MLGPLHSEVTGVRKVRFGWARRVLCVDRHGFRADLQAEPTLPRSVCGCARIPCRSAGRTRRRLRNRTNRPARRTPEVSARERPARREVSAPKPAIRPENPTNRPAKRPRRNPRSGQRTRRIAQLHALASLGGRTATNERGEHTRRVHPAAPAHLVWSAAGRGAPALVARQPLVRSAAGRGAPALAYSSVGDPPRRASGERPLERARGGAARGRRRGRCLGRRPRRPRARRRAWPWPRGT